jgi:AcrR family transcriptional regulator
MGLQQPSEPAAIGDSARLDLRDADPLVRTTRPGRPAMTPRARGARRTLPDPANDRGGAYDDGTRRTEILQTAATLIASSGLRTSLQEIADAAGILPGSLYHHFESKEAILVELVQRYYADLDRIGEIAHEKLDKSDSRSAADKIVDLGSAIARCAVEHRAALQMSFYEAPNANSELVELLQKPPTAVQQAMLQTLRAGRWSGFIRSDIDLPTLADRICQTMMHVGLDIIRHTAGADETAIILCRIMLHGLASRPLSDEELDRSNAFAAAEAAIKTWADESDVEANDKAAHVRAVARAEFGRKGHHNSRHRFGSGPGHRDGVPADRIEGRTSRLDHGIVRHQGRRWIRQRSTHRRHSRGKAGCAQLGQHQCVGPISRRVEDPARLDAPVTAGHSQPGFGIHHAATAAPNAVVGGHCGR